MATNDIHVTVSDNNPSASLRVSSETPLRSVNTDNGSPYYVGARAYVTQTASGATVTVIDKEGTTTAVINNGADGADGQDGADGNGITDISLTSSSGNVDTYTITYDDGTTDTFDITNGVDGQDGQDGQDGADGTDGFSPIATVSKVGDTATISITDANGTTTASISDGTDGVDGQDGADGADGFSPSATVSKSGDTATITITDKDGTTTASISDGSGGASAFVAEFGTTTYADVKDAYDNDAILVCTVDDSGNTMVLQLVYFDATNEIFFFAEPNGDGFYWTELSNANGWDDGTRYLASTDVATQLRDGLMSALDKQKLDGLSKRNIWYGTCSTSASQSPKAITTASGDFELTTGSMLCVLFSHANSLSSVSLQVDSGTSKAAYSMDGTSDIANRWGSNEVVMFAYDGTKFILLEQGKASTTAYGITKLNNTVTSTSTSEAATANAVKEAYDNGGVQSVNGSTGAVTVTVPTNVSDLNNDSGFITSSDIPEEVFMATYGSTTSAEIESAYQAGKVVQVIYDTGTAKVIGEFAIRISSAYHVFATAGTSNGCMLYSCESDVWTLDTVTYQEPLVSGTNIKTINNTSLLGSGDITVASSGTSVPTADEVAEFDSTAHMNSTDMTASEVSDFVDSLDAQGANLADYVVEQGSSGIWTYRKWNSGIAECWGTYTASIAITISAVGYGGYRSSNLSIPTFPLTFISAPSVTATANTAQGYWVNNINGISTTGGSFYLSSGTSLAAADRSIAFHVSGKWK